MIGGALGRGYRRAAAAVPWYLAGGVSAANCIAAYQPKGASSLEASYVNLANPGTYNLSGATPAFDSALGYTDYKTFTNDIPIASLPALFMWSGKIRGQANYGVLWTNTGYFTGGIALTGPVSYNNTSYFGYNAALATRIVQDVGDVSLSVATYAYVKAADYSQRLYVNGNLLQTKAGTEPTIFNARLATGVGGQCCAAGVWLIDPTNEQVAALHAAMIVL